MKLLRRYFHNPRRLLNLYFATFVFLINLVSLALVAVGLIVLLRMDILYVGELDTWGGLGLLFLLNAVACSIVGAVLSGIFNKTLFRPIYDIIGGMNTLAEGKYDVRVDLGKSALSKEVSQSFNTLATELESTEMLRSDFVNNFSHEFKTPIVSIAGFAKLLKRGSLSEEEKSEYLDIIESESLRLSSMATSVMALTKIENQAVLTDVTEFNLSEQLRTCVLILENQWSKRNTEMCLDFAEYKIRANEEMLRQVWINLLDNAIKYSPEGSTVSVAVLERGGDLSVSVSNTGSTIEPEHQKKIFNKFYQTDESHSSVGNGIGLAIVKKVVELHRGSVRVESGNNKTTFTVTLPR